jgi:hypothetical protein
MPKPKPPQPVVVTEPRIVVRRGARLTPRRVRMCVCGMKARDCRGYCRKLTDAVGMASLREGAAL